jgi:hypothetical protein
MGIISKSVSSLNKGSLAILFREPIHLHLEKYFRDGHISEHTFKHAQFKVIVQEGKLVDTLLAHA